MAKAVKLADIAERLSVSTVTVSKALSGQKGVSEEMREKIKSLAEELGYQQPSARKSQNTGNSYNIGVPSVHRKGDGFTESRGLMDKLRIVFMGTPDFSVP